SGESVILNFQDGTYYGLDPVGALVWKLVQEPRTVAEIQEALLAEFDVERLQCEKDLQAFLLELWGRKLVKTIDR
ncbi:PqqD family protein, partial [Thermodesulfobacteriota bacterium]